MTKGRYRAKNNNSRLAKAAATGRDTSRPTKLLLLLLMGSMARIGGCRQLWQVDWEIKVISWFWGKNLKWPKSTLAEIGDRDWTGSYLPPSDRIFIFTSLIIFTRKDQVAPFKEPDRGVWPPSLRTQRTQSFWSAVKAEPGEERKLRWALHVTEMRFSKVESRRRGMRGLKRGTGPAMGGWGWWGRPGRESKGPWRKANRQKRSLHYEF